MIEYTYLLAFADVGDVDDRVKLQTADGSFLIVGHRETIGHKDGKWLGGYTVDIKVIDGTDFNSGWKNSRDDFGLVVTNNDVIGIPEPNMSFVSIPGTSVILDLSEYIGSEITYARRQLTFDFAFEHDPDNYIEYFSNFLDVFHGKRVWLHLDLDPNYLYRGRVSCGKISRTLSICEFTATVTCDPMKYLYYYDEDDHEYKVSLADGRL